MFYNYLWDGVDLGDSEGPITLHVFHNDAMKMKLQHTAGKLLSIPTVI